MHTHVGYHPVTIVDDIPVTTGGRELCLLVRLVLTSRKMVLFIPRPWYRRCWQDSWQIIRMFPINFLAFRKESLDQRHNVYLILNVSFSRWIWPTNAAVASETLHLNYTCFLYSHADIYVAQSSWVWHALVGNPCMVRMLSSLRSLIILMILGTRAVESGAG